MCWKFNEIYIENKNNTGKIRGCIMDNLISTQRKKNDMLPSYRTMKYKSPIWGYFHVQKE